MKKRTKIVHFLIRVFGLDRLLASYSDRFNFLQKFVPLPSEYPDGTRFKVLRDNVVFDLFVCDYMQWFVFANLPDNGWRYALDRIRFGARGGVVLDIGSNVGAFSLKLAKNCLDHGVSDVRIVGFEPNTLVSQRLHNNLSLNAELQCFISINNLAVGATCGTVPMVFEAANTGHGRVSSAGEESQFSVLMTTIDSFIENGNFQRLDFIKIDVEGYEPFVIDGGVKSVERFKPDIYIEITPNWFEARGRSALKLFEVLRSFGYRLFFEDGNNLVPLESYCGHLPAQYNVLALFHDHPSFPSGKRQ